MKSFQLNKFIGGLSRGAKRVVAMTLCSVMLVSIFTALGIDFGLPGLVASAAESQTEYQSINEYQYAEFARIQNEIFSYGSGTLNPSHSDKTSDKDGAAFSKTAERYTSPDQLVKYLDSGYATVKQGNPYFNWTNTDQGVSDGTISRWRGETSSSSYNYYTYSGSIYYYANRMKTVGGISYAVYDVSSAADFYAVMSMTDYAAVNTSGNRCNYMLINLTKDIDMNGENYSFEPFAANSSSNFYLYIEGNGHTIYNMRIQGAQTYGAGLFSVAPRYFACRNLGFRSSMVLNTADTTGGSSGTGLLASRTNRKFVIENVHSNIAYMQTRDTDTTGMGGMIGRTNGVANYGDRFIKNTSTTGHIMFGGMHLGGMTSFASSYITYNGSTSGNSTTNRYINSFKKSYDVEYPADVFGVVMTTNQSTNSSYPLMIFNSSSTDCTLFSLGADSGSFISCGCGLRVKNCYSNNTIYAKNNTGGFIGRSADINTKTNTNVTLKDAAGTISVTSHFENCYSCGVVEGTVAMGGFVGLLNGRRSAEGDDTELAIAASANNSQTTASTVFTNCFSTAMVGMDYAGKYCGGFAGLDDNYVSNSTLVNWGGSRVGGKGTCYVNCYAAGEVGNILTVTDIDAASDYETEFFGTRSGAGNYPNDRSNSKDGSTIYDYYPTGGFIGAINLDRYRYHVHGDGTSGIVNNWFGNFYNCYYDKQTTAMREIAVGLKGVGVNSSSLGSIMSSTDFALPGVTGIYTEKSDVKGVAGLTDFGQAQAELTEKTPNPVPTQYMDPNGEASTVWSYTDEYYPQIKAMMVCDLTVPLSSVTEADINALSGKRNDPKSSVFYIKNSPASDFNAGTTATAGAGVVSNYQKPVQSLARVINNVNGVPVYHGTSVISEANALAATQFAGVAQAFRYCQAATATVLLDHWDTLLVQQQNNAQGSNWQTDDPARELQKAAEGHVTEIINGEEKDVWYIDFDGLRVGTYEFKITTPNWTYNYGRDYFQDLKNMSLNVKVDNANVRIKFYYDKGTLVSGSTQFMVKVEDRNGLNTLSYNGTDCSYYYVHEYEAPADNTYKPVDYYIPGSFSNYISGYWWADGDQIKLDYIGENANGHHIYSKTLENISSANYAYVDNDSSKGYMDHFEFKVRTGGTWIGFYGNEGATDNNMSFKVGDTPTTVTITYDEDGGITESNGTKIGLTTVSGDGVTDIVDHGSNYNYTPKENTIKLAGTFSAFDSAGKEWGDSSIYLTYSGRTDSLGNHIYSITLPLTMAGAVGSHSEDEPYAQTQGWSGDNGTYRFKIVDDGSWFGYDGGNDNMLVHIDADKSVTFNYVEETHITSVVGADGDYTHYQYEGEENRYFLMGTLTDWGSGQAMSYVEDNAKGEHIYAYTLTNVAAGDYEFKVKDGDHWYGYACEDGGMNNNMKVKVTDSTNTITVKFNTETHGATVEGTGFTADTGYDASETGDDGVDSALRGKYSIIGKQTVINNGWDWKTKNNTENIIQACKDGLMTENNGIWTYTFTLDEATATRINNNDFELFAYKVVYQGDESYTTGGNRNFTIVAAPNEESFAGKQIVITYDPNASNADATTVSSPDATLNASISQTAVVGDDYEYYITGDKKLLGSRGDWMNGDDITSADGRANKEELETKYKLTYNTQLGEYQITLNSGHFAVNNDDASKLPAGEYSFKITYKLPWSSGIDFGDPGTTDGNYHLNVLADAENVTIHFNPNAAGACKIYCTSTTDGAIVYNDYYLAADVSFNKFIPNHTADASWQFENDSNLQARMPYNYNTNTNRIWIHNVDVNQVIDPATGLDSLTTLDGVAFSYAIKVTPFDKTKGEHGQGVDEKGSNYVFSLLPDSTENYQKLDLLITYDMSAGTNSLERTSIRVYPPGTDESALTDSVEAKATVLTRECLVYPAVPAVYAVMGADTLTGYNWGFTSLDAWKRGYLVNAQLANMQEGLWYTDPDSKARIDVPLDDPDLYILQTPYTVNTGDNQFTADFKIAADCSNATTFPSDNYKLTLKKPDGVEATTCNVYVLFNEKTEEISVVAYNPDDSYHYSFVVGELNEDFLKWYLAAGPALFNNSFGQKSASASVYDTVRDITADFYFTAGTGSEQRGIVIDRNLESGRNVTDKLKSSINFALDYQTTDTVTEDGATKTNVNNVTGEFKADVLDLNVDAVLDEQTGDQVKSSDYIAKFSVDQFAPGKQWLTVGTIGYGVDEVYNEWKNKYAKYNFYQKEYKNFYYYYDLYKQQFSNVTYNGKAITTVDDLITYLDYFYNDSIADYQDIVSVMHGYDVREHWYGVEGGGDSAVDIEGVSYTIPSIQRMQQYNWDESTMTVNGVSYDLDEAVYVVLDSSSIVGTRDIRLIPTTYLEAGVDAKVNVIQAASDASGSTASNSIMLNYSSDDAYLDAEHTQLNPDAPYKFSGSVDKTVVKDGNTTNNTTDYGYDIDTIAFGYYNFAVSSAYVASDKVGLGVNTNYDKNEVTPYSPAEIRDDNDSSVRDSDPSGKGYRYFAMSSAYHDTAHYTDNGSRATAGLSVDTFDSMSMIGPTLNELNNNPAVDRDGDGEVDVLEGNTRIADEGTANERVQIYVSLTESDLRWCDFRMNLDPHDSNYGMYQYLNPDTNEWVNYDYGSRTYAELATTRVLVYKAHYDDGKLIRGEAVPFTKSTLGDGNNSTAATNYRKWTGQQNFTAEDAGSINNENDNGTYEVVFLWRLEDGRYLEDSKVVTIVRIQPGLTKSVDVDFDGPGSNELQYTVTYTNEKSDLLIDFALLDVLPVQGDSRYEESWVGHADGITHRHTKFNSNKFKITSFRIEEDQRSDIKEVYYTNSNEPLSWMYYSDYLTTDDPSHFYTVTEDKRDEENRQLYVIPASVTGSEPDEAYQTTKTQEIEGAEGQYETIIVYQSISNSGTQYPNDNYAKATQTVRKPQMLSAEDANFPSNKIVFATNTEGRDTGKIDDSQTVARGGIWTAVNTPSKPFGYGTGDYPLNGSESTTFQELYPQGLYQSGGEANWDITALLVTGIQLARGQSVKFIYNLEYTGSLGDQLINNAFYSVKPSEDTTDTNRTSSFSNTVSTSIMTRSISGYAWIDANGDGVIDSNEQKLRNVKVRLYQKMSGDNNNEYMPTDLIQYTNANGRYEFMDIPAGNYQIRFMDPDGSETIYNQNNQPVKMSDLSSTLTHPKSSNFDPVSSHYLIDPEGGVGTHNLASIRTGTANDGTKFNYVAINSVTALSNETIAVSMDGVFANAVQENNSYSVYNMNAGFSFSTNYNFSINVDKVTQYNTKLKGAKFQLYFYHEQDQNDSSDTAPTGWYPIYYIIESNSEEHMGTVPLTVEQLQGKVSEALANMNDYANQYRNAERQAEETEQEFNARKDKLLMQVDSWRRQAELYNIDYELNDDGTVKEFHGLKYYTSDTNGNISFLGLDKGDYKLQEVETVEGYLPYNEELFVHLPYEAANSKTISGIAWLDTNHNYVVEEGETILGNSIVKLYRLDENGAEVEVASATSAANGSYKFDNLLSGRYVVKAQNGSEWVQLNNHAIQVVNPNITGTAKDGETTLAGRQLVLYTTDGSTDTATEIVTNTDSNGQYTFQNVPSGTYKVYYNAGNEETPNYKAVTDAITVDNPLLENADFSMSAEAGTRDAYVLYATDDVVGYKHVTVQVINNKQQFDIPITGFGQDHLWWMLLIGLLMFALGGAAFILVFKKREKLQAIKIPTVESIADKIKRGK